MILEKEPRYDMQKPPMRQHLRLLIWLLSWFVLRLHGSRIRRVGMEGVKGPYLLLCNHNAFMDFMVASHALRFQRANFIVAIDGFIGREWLLRYIGCICTRKFVSDYTLVRHCKTVVERGDVVALYPEARYSLCGTTAVLPDSVGKLAKMLGVPVVTLICHGHHVNSPFYHLPDHGVKCVEAEMRCIVSADEIKTLKAPEIMQRIRDAFVYDDYRWQQEKHVRIRYKKRAEGLQKVLYQCPHCRTEYRMLTEGTRLSCGSCGKTWELDEYGKLHALEGETEFDHVPDWYEWERANVRKEVEEGRYLLDVPAHVCALPNAKGYIPLGSCRLRHDMSGFHVTGTYEGEDYEIVRDARDIYSCHIEYEYLGKYGDCIDLNTKDNTYYIYPETPDCAVTKIALATEELWEWSGK
ncbi:MAG: 1-acyl-sn-glycerol-3-phosphate acyltransferase [Lachnospiraceae bacterium]|nr:1-acyl-sn-glycerol-3-phosphate acyltransferase [Lachnospiraceae bacterium]